MEKPPAEFERIESDTETRKLLIETARTSASATIWTKDQKITFESHFTSYDEKGGFLYVWIPTQLDPEELNTSVLASKALADRACFFNVSLSRANIFFRAEFMGYDSQGYKFRIPDKIFKVQRRAYLRFLIPLGHVIKVEFQDPYLDENTISRKVYDVSGGGLSILLEPADLGLFEAGTVLKNVRLTVNGRKLTCNALIRHINPKASGRGHDTGRMGVEFQNIKEADRQHIVSYVFEETRRIYSRFL